MARVAAKLRTADASRLRLLIIVSRKHTRLHNELRRRHEGRDWVSVILDRRHAERRTTTGRPAVERRRRERRMRPEVDRQLRLYGLAQVWLLSRPDRAGRPASPDPDEVTASVKRFLHERKRRRFCELCIVEGAALPLDAVMVATLALDGIHSEYGACSGCRKRGWTWGALG